MHGVASGDPLSDAVILWTRVTPVADRWRRRSPRRVLVGWEVATDSGFSNLVRRGSAFVSRRTDFTLKVDARGLQPDTEYHYRFRTLSGHSTTGRTKTLPAPATSVASVKLAVMSCSNYPAGYFNVYRAASELANLDAVVHLGDYIYEYGQGGYATENAADLGRDFLEGNDTEILSLQDYRTRYAQYRGDPDLQALHAVAPFICVWDDHEVTNDAWKDGAENHNEGEGSFEKRKRRALRAYFEWMPIRPVQKRNREIIYRNFEFGSLVNLMMLDTRLVGRDQQLDLTNYVSGDDFLAENFAADVASDQRSLLGQEQLQWLQNTMIPSAATWQVLGQQVLMGRMNLPAELLLNLADPSTAAGLLGELAPLKARLLAGDPTLTPQERARVEVVLPYNLDAWDGYQFEREVILNTAEQFGKNLVVLAGDTHNAWANNLKTFSGSQAGVEFATASVTSPGLEAFLQLPPVAWPSTETVLELLIDDLQYMNVGDRGFMTVEFTGDQVTSNWHYVSSITDRDVAGNPVFSINSSRAKSITVAKGQPIIDP